MAMKRARISELKNRLSHYLDFVRRGQPVLVYDRDRVIARIEPVGSDLADSEAWLLELERTGAVRPPTASLPSDWLERRVNVKVDVTRALLDERESGR